MGDLKYLDFDLAIEPSGDGFVARVFNSPGGQASGEFKAPFSDLEIENFLLRVGRTRHAVRRIESPEMAAAKTFGGQLFNGVFTGDVRGCLRSSIDEASRQGAGLRVRLHLGKVPALADLPWEFLYNASMNRFLTLSVDTPLVRFLDLPERIRPIAVRPPLRVLMMVSSPTDYPRLDVKRETSKMAEALNELEQRGMVAVDVLENASLAELQRRLRAGQFHIFHFIGHGGFDAQAQDGVLVLEDAEERGRRVSAQFLGTLLHDHRPLRLAVLNACEGARASRNDPFAGTAQSLLQQGIPAVIAMQFEVTDEAAICFTREFYASIASGYPVDAALAEARKAIFAEVSEIEWGTPVLYMRAPDGRIFEVEKTAEIDRRQLHIASLMTSARAALAAKDVAGAVSRFKQVLTIDAAHKEALAALDEIRRREEDSVSAETRARQLTELRRGAGGAMAAELWDDAVEKWRALLAITPDDAEAKAGLARAREQQDCAAVYARGRALFDKRSWREALAELHQVQQMMPGYKDVPALIAAIDRELSTPIAPTVPSPALSTPQAVPSFAPAPPVQTATTSPVPPAPRARWALPGGAMGVVLVCAAVVGLIGLGLYLADQNGSFDQPLSDTRPADSSSSDSGTPSPSRSLADASGSGSSGGISASTRAALEATLSRGSAAEVEAYRTLNPMPLRGVYTGDAFELLEAAIEALRMTGVYAVTQLHGREFGTFEVTSGGDRAEVTFTERWSTTFHYIQNQLCAFRFLPHDVPQTAYLERRGKDWMIYDTDQHSPVPQPAPCR